jgi:hypothetical protein
MSLIRRKIHPSCGAALKVAFLWAGLVAAQISTAAPFTAGNFIVSHRLRDSTRPRLLEYTFDGELVQSMLLPFSPTGSRDLVVDRYGRAHINQAPALTMHDPATGQQTQLFDNDYRNDLGGSAGGVAAYGDYIYATSQDEIFRFNLATGSSEMLDARRRSRDVILGHDGLLYINSPSGVNQVYVHDPVTFEQLREIFLPDFSYSSLAVDKNGHIFAGHGFDIDHLDPDGNLIKRVTPNIGGFFDIDLSSDGTLLASTHAFIAVLDKDLNIHTIFETPGGRESDGTWVAFLEPPPVPEPSSLILASLGLLAAYKRSPRR